MRQRLGSLTAVCLAAGLVAGCGSGTKTVTVTTPPAATATTPAAGSTGVSGATGTTTPATGTTGSASARLKAAEAANPAIARQVAQAVASCKASINGQASLTAADKSKLDSICDKAGTGDTAGVQQATAEVCQQIIKDTVPASAQAQALAACPKP